MGALPLNICDALVETGLCIYYTGKPRDWKKIPYVYLLPLYDTLSLRLPTDSLIKEANKIISKMEGDSLYFNDPSHLQKLVYVSAVTTLDATLK